MSTTDLTRWNRAGLRRFRYVDGNAATYLEELRLLLAKKFPGWAAVDLELPAAETSQERDARLLSQYEAGRSALPDWAWEISRSLARALHVLTEHVDAYANEGYLGTATQWESLRRLVEMIDYRPAPPASASTHLVLAAPAGVAGTLAPGFAVRHAPADGSAPVVFETLEPLEIDAAVNALRPAGWGASGVLLEGKWIALEEKVQGLAIGQPLVLENEATGRAEAHVIDGLLEQETTTEIHVTHSIAFSAFTRGKTVVHVRPREKLAPLGPARSDAQVGTTLHLQRAPEGLKVGHVVTVSDGLKRRYRRVGAVDGPGLRVTVDRPVAELVIGQARMARPIELEVARDKGTQAGSGNPPVIEHFVQVVGDWSRLTGEVVGDPRTFSDPTRVGEYRCTVVAPSDVPVRTTDEENKGHTLLKLVQDPAATDPAYDVENPQVVLVPPLLGTGWELDVPLSAADEASHLPVPLAVAQPRALASGDFAVAVTGSQASWGRLTSVSVDADRQCADLRPEGNQWQGRGGGDFYLCTTRVYGHFQVQARVAGWNVNGTTLDGEKKIPLEVAPAALAHGRRLLVEVLDAGGTTTLVTQVEAVDGNTLILVDALPAGATVGNVVISGNVVPAGHGERKPEKVLGSGDATRSGQTFVLDEPRLSFIPDATMTSGVSADVEVKVEGRGWTQVSSFRDSGPTDPHFVVRMQENGAAAFVFGDGQAGRRLPTGVNNVRISYRAGTGLSGNLPAGRFTRPARPSTLVASVRQPLPAAGGNDMESVGSLRETAPKALLTLERAVSLSDFANLAQGHSSVWQARAFRRPSGGQRDQQRVEVIVVPAGGGALGPLERALADHLMAHALPGVEVVVRGYASRRVNLDVTLEIDTAAYEPRPVVRAAEAALYDALSLRRRLLGQPLYLSDVYKAVEEVTGVESSRCVIDDDPSLQRWDAASDQVIHLDPGKPGLLVRYQRYAP